MDTPGNGHLESSSDSSDDPDNKLPELSRSQTTLESPPSPGLKKRKSQRTRPIEVLEKQHAAPPAPLKTPARQPEVRPRPSKMSLFNLFSKPKVEKLRGYAEQGLSTPAAPASRTASNGETTGSKQNAAVRVQPRDSERDPSRPTTSRSYSAMAARFMSKENIPPVTPSIPNDRKPRAFDPPPLFQVWPQTTKHGTFEVPPTTLETVLQKPKSRANPVLYTPGGETPSLNIPGNRGSIESRITVKTTIRHARSSSNLALMSPAKKLFVLTTSGYLLQYAENGLNERLPEKILRLGKDSAAYASDLVPGKHHVLQIAHAVDQNGVIVGDSQSIFSRFGMRGQPKRVSSNFLIVMPNAEEMAAWMKAIRKEIQVQGGRRIRSDSNTRPKTGKPVLDLKKTPSVSHRYQIRRDPNGPSNVGSPTTETFATPPAVEQNELEKPLPEKPKETAENEESRKQEEPPMARPRAPSDTPSISSSAAISVDQQQLDKLRNSTRMSRTSTVATSVTAASRTNSMASSPSDQSTDSYDAGRDAKLSYRSLSSFTLAKRRSAVPLCLKEPPRSDPGAFLSLQQSAVQDMIHSPVVGYASPIPEPTPSPKKNRLSTAQSAPNLKSIAEPNSSLPFPLSTPPEERPESFLADLPDPTTWTNKHSPNHRNSVTPFPPLLESQATADFNQDALKRKSRPSVTSRPLRNSSNSFSIPLRVNPIEPASPQSPKTLKSPDRPEPSSSGEQEERVSSPIPAVTTLEAKVDIGKRTTIDSSHIPPRKSSTSGSPPRDLPSKRRGSKLSLFPPANPLPPPPSSVVQKNMRNRSPSAASVSTFTPSPVAPNGTRLARPASLQVRTDHAPFLSSMRKMETEGPARSVTTVPIRSLKPSRSAGNMVARAMTPSPADNFNFFNKAKPSSDSEAADQITPLVDSLHSPLILGSLARPQSGILKAPRTRASMPDIALGPPAPPPSTPLPAPPGPAQKTRLSIIRTGTPIGVAIGEALHEVQGESPTKAPLTMGLGIQVGGQS